MSVSLRGGTALAQLQASIIVDGGGRRGEHRLPHGLPVDSSLVRARRRAIALVAVYAAGVATLLACTDEGGSTARTGGPSATAAAPSTTLASTTTTEPSTTTTRGELGSGQAVTFVFAGDVNFEGSIGVRLAADPATVLREVQPTLASADLAMVNLETAIAEGGTPQPKEFTFQAPPVALDALRAAGVDVVSEANNHGMDFGLPGLEQSLAARADRAFPVLGIGHDIDEAFAAYTTEIKGQRISIIAATQVLDSSLIGSWTAGPGKPGVASAKLVDRLVAEVERARESSDTVVVFLHWGVERMTCPTADQQSLATTLTAAGADIIVGSHAHRVLGGGRMGAAVVHYGLGNFAFYAGSAAAAETGIFEVTATGRRIDSYQWRPARINDRIPSPLGGDEAQAGLDHWNGLRECTGLAP
jgi:poly-gamma-glutamate synthesis protein (capsule biosynthesis protein)